MRDHHLPNLNSVTISDQVKGWRNTASSTRKQSRHERDPGFTASHSQPPAHKAVFETTSRGACEPLPLRFLRRD
eukprot:scaffold115_cov304-Prasinococcus_capsulatus_cf.AAC.58